MINFKIFKYEDNSELIKFYNQDNYLVNEMYIINNEFFHCKQRGASIEAIKTLKKVGIIIKDKFVSIINGKFYTSQLTGSNAVLKVKV